MGAPRGSREMKRLEKELADIKSMKDALFTAHAVNGDMTHWKAKMTGPKDTPYESGTFFLDVKIGDDYPYSPPKIKFTTKIWHPNISSQTGAICLDVLGKEWSPALTIRTALLSIQALLSLPEPDDPQDAEVASMYKQNRSMFIQTAKYWTSTFAQDSGDKTQEDSINRIVEMGFDGAQARAALEKHSWDETRALNSLLG
jgi:ubiquitin-conjugating enzyme (huntingtin interacting protein 2)